MSVTCRERETYLNNRRGLKKQKKLNKNHNSVIPTNTADSKVR